MVYEFRNTLLNYITIFPLLIISQPELSGFMNRRCSLSGPFEINSIFIVLIVDFLTKLFRLYFSPVEMQNFKGVSTSAGPIS